MATEYYYDITYLETKTVGENEDQVYNINWRYIGTADDGTQGKIVYNTYIDPSVSENTIPFADLEAETVVGWIEQNISPAEAKKIKDAVDGIIERKSENRIAKDLPWLAESE